MYNRQERTHSLTMGKSKIDIYPEHKRLYKFVSWRESKSTVKDYLISKLKVAHPEITKVGDLDLNMISVNPMRRSRFGSFYLEVKGEILDSKGSTIANFLDLNFEHVALDEAYETHDEKEVEERKTIEEKFGKDQYSKEFCMRTQALDEILNTCGGTLTLSSDRTKDSDEFLEKIMKLTGWTSTEDNRIHSRIKRLPPYMEVPE